ncbi:HesB/YadR/YfhF family protein [Niallia sp. 01092]|uniref:HesB/YadR/YfhF family protein n=1 Tax=unclassified Niallia TaxID=2837522 RepID=UPI003FD2D4CC
MNLKIEENAVQWFKEVAELKKGETVRLMISYEEEAINRSYYPGFSLKFLVEVPNLLVTHFKKDGILFILRFPMMPFFKKNH